MLNFILFSLLFNQSFAQLDLEEGKSQCVLRISFGSYSSGVPRDIVKKIEDVLESEKESITEIKRWNWGLEGEFDLCPIFKNEQTMQKIHDQIKDLIPETSKKGYTTLFLNGVETKKTVWPKN